MLYRTLLAATLLTLAATSPISTIPIQCDCPKTLCIMELIQVSRSNPKILSYHKYLPNLL